MGGGLVAPLGGDSLHGLSPLGGSWCRGDGLWGSGAQGSGLPGCGSCSSGGREPSICSPSELYQHPVSCCSPLLRVLLLCPSTPLLFGGLFASKVLCAAGHSHATPPGLMARESSCVSRSPGNRQSHEWPFGLCCPLPPPPPPPQRCSQKQHLPLNGEVCSQLEKPNVYTGAGMDPLRAMARLQGTLGRPPGAIGCGSPWPVASLCHHP